MRGSDKKRTPAQQMFFFLVREAGVEPARPCEHWHLKPASLPIPPLARGVCAVLFSASSILPQSFASVNTFLQKNHFLAKRMFLQKKG